MRYNEFNKTQVTEMSASSNPKRYSSELGALVAFTDANSLDSIPDSKLADPKKIKKSIDDVSPQLNKKIFDAWHKRALEYIEIILAHNGSLPQKYGWVAGQNIGPVADVEFHNFPISGLSIKDEGGITLTNISPEALGLEPLRGNDVYEQYAPRQYATWKTKIFKAVIAEAKASPGTPIGGDGRYTITYDADTGDFTIFHKKTWTMTESDIMDNLIKNAPWQRPFGDWYQTNFQQYKDWMKPLVVALSKQFTDIMSKALESSDQLKKILQFEEKPYYYATHKALYYVPGAADAGDLELKGIWYGEPDGTSQLFKAKIGNEESDDGAVIDLYVRYANGMFAANPTARVQSLRDPEFIAWDKL